HAYRSYSHLSCSCSGHHPHLHPFPTRRSSDLTSPANPRRLYALIDSAETGQGGLYRSDDRGLTWRKTTGDKRIWNRGWYFGGVTDRKSTRLNSSHQIISYAVFCLKKKNKTDIK